LLSVGPPSVAHARPIGDCTAPRRGLQRNRAQRTHTRSWNGLPTCESTPIHSLSLRVGGAVVGLMNVGAPHESAPSESNVPLFTATVFGGVVRSKPSPA